MASVLLLRLTGEFGSEEGDGGEREVERVDVLMGRKAKQRKELSEYKLGGGRNERRVERNEDRRVERRKRFEVDRSL
jgi:hypothetical protein